MNRLRVSVPGETGGPRGREIEKGWGKKTPQVAWSMHKSLHMGCFDPIRDKGKLDPSLWTLDHHFKLSIGCGIVRWGGFHQKFCVFGVWGGAYRIRITTLYWL